MKLNYLAPMSLSLNPLKFLRVMDHIFYLDDRTKDSLAECRMKNHQYPMADPRFFKRIIKIENDLATGVQKFYFEEKFPLKCKKFPGEETYGYLQEW